jgi:hypothetical protein
MRKVFYFNLFSRKKAFLIYSSKIEEKINRGKTRMKKIPTFDLK